MTALPALPAVPERPPIPLGEVKAALAEELTQDDWRLAEAMLLVIDVGNLEALLDGRREGLDQRGLHDPEEVLGGRAVDLPDFLTLFLARRDEGQATGQAAVTLLWQAYFRYLLELADASGSGFLASWAGFELPLRNGLARYRADRLGVDVQGALIDEPNAPANHEDLLARLAEESDPLARERLLDSARLAAIEAHSGIDPFSVDAVLAYLAGCLVLDRWDLPRTADAQSLLEVFA